MSFLAALQFLTTIPLRVRANFSDEQLGASVAWYPVVGFLLGLLLVGVRVVLYLIFASPILDALTLLAWVLLTGGLHLDGLMDACDGLLAHRSADERLRIMKDSHVGAWGVIGGVLLLLIKFSALSALSPGLPSRWMSALLLAPTLARWAMALCVIVFPYGRPAGWGQVLKTHANRSHLLFATFATTLIVALLGSVAGAVSWVCVLLVALGLARFALDRLPGLTGDVYGAIAEVSEAVVLLVFAVYLL